MKRYLNYIGLLSILGLIIMFVFANRAQTQSISEGSPERSPQTITSTPPVFSYQGQLLDSNGDPINDTVPMTFKLYSQNTGGTACWTENYTGGNEVVVENGRFSVLLGSITPIPDTCFENDTYLELVIDSETLAPRELLTSVVHAVEASTLPHDAITGGSLNIASGPDGEGGQIRLQQGDTGNDWVMDNRLGEFRLLHSGQIYFSIASDGTTNIDGSLNLNGNLSTIGIDTPFSIATERPWQFEQRGSGSGTTTVLRSTTNAKNFRFLSEDDTPILSIYAVNGGGSVTVHNDLTISGSCTASAAFEDNSIASAIDPTCTGGSLTTGAIIEANLQTPAEMQSDTIERFDLGDLLCWATDVEQLEQCDTANDRLVMAVANRNGKPIVIGAEPIKVIGSVRAGDILVTSNVSGHAMVNNNPSPGTVIGQALEDFDGESGLIKAMIRKW